MKIDKQNLIAKIREIADLSTEEKSQLIELLNHTKKYGLVWEDKPEAAEQLLAESLPMLKEDAIKALINTENKNAPNHILIEGDNLHALTTLCYTHEKQIDVIYIDPPYNTGNEDDFKYNDDYVDKEDAFRHSKWLSFINKRLKLAKRLLKDSGVIFVSIGDDEVSQLILLMNDLFGEENKLGIIARVAKTAGDRGAYFAPSKDYVLAYSKQKISVSDFNDEVDESLFKKVEEDGERKGEKYRDDVAFYQSSLDPMRGCTNQRYFIKCPDNSLAIPPGNNLPDAKIEGGKIPPFTGEDKVWRWSDETYKSKKHLLVFKKTKNSPLLDANGQKSIYNVYTKSYLKDRAEGGKSPRDFLDGFINRKGADLIKQYDIDFNYSKPVELIEHLVKITDKPNNIKVLDVFAGSGTTLQSVLELNKKDGGKRTCILATNNEVPSKILKVLKSKNATQEEIEENGICRTVSYPRCSRLIIPYINKKGVEMPHFPNNNLRYFKMEFVSREKILKNKRQLMQLCADVLRVKHNCYNEIKGAKQIRIFNENDLYVIALMDDVVIPEAIKIIEKLPMMSRIKVYVFAEGHEPYTEDFMEVLHRVELCALPDAIYKAYQNILPKKKFITEEVD